MKTYRLSPFVWAAFLLFLLASCRAIKPIENTEYKNFDPVELEPQAILEKIPGSPTPLQSVKGKGKALISTPDGSDRVSLTFAGNRDTSRLSIQNRIGINGGELLATGDSILIYDKIDQKAHKISIKEAHATQINSLASTNVVEILNYQITAEQVDNVLANKQYYLLVLVDNTRVRVSRDHHNIMSVTLPEGAGKAYNSINYESYSTLDGHSLPRKITITSADRSSRVTLLIRSLDANPTSLDLALDLPDQITVQHL